MRSLMQLLTAAVASFGVGLGAAVIDGAHSNAQQPPQASPAPQRSKADASPAAEPERAPEESIARPKPPHPAAASVTTASPHTELQEPLSPEPCHHAEPAPHPTPTATQTAADTQPDDAPPLALSIGLKSRW